MFFAIRRQVTQRNIWVAAAVIIVLCGSKRWSRGWFLSTTYIAHDLVSNQPGVAPAH